MCRLQRYDISSWAAGALQTHQPATRGYIWPVTETSPAAVRAAISAEPISVAEHEELVSRSGAGAVVAFGGVVRDHDHGRGVTQLEYVGHPSAEELMAEIAAEIAAQPKVYAIAITHRIGLLGVGDVALAAAVSAAHRGEAFDACRQLVEEVKARLPIWKRQVFTDGDEEWVAAP